MTDLTLAMQLARLIHDFGLHFLAGLLIFITYTTASLITYNHCRKTILQHADDEARKYIHDLEAELKTVRARLADRKDACRREADARRAMTELLARAMKVDASLKIEKGE